MTIPAVRISVMPQFPAQVVGADGIQVNKQNGTFTIGDGFENLVLLTSVPNPSQKMVKVYDSVAGIYNTVLMSSLISGSVTPAFNTWVVTTGASYPATAADDVIVVKKTVGSATAITLPSSVGRTRPYYIKDGKGDAATNNITVTGTSETIDGMANVVIATNYGSVSLMPMPGGGWLILNFG